jgi:hypothetical protein
MASHNSLKVGDRVAYSVKFLKSIYALHSEMSQAKGIVSKIKNLDSVNLVFVEWKGNCNFPEKVVEPNLAKVGPNTDYCNCE